MSQLLANHLHFSIKFFTVGAICWPSSASGLFPSPVVGLLSRKHSTVARYKLKTATNRQNLSQLLDTLEFIYFTVW